MKQLDPPMPTWRSILTPLDRRRRRALDDSSIDYPYDRYPDDERSNDSVWCTEASFYGNLPLLQWLRNHGACWEPRTIMAGALSGNAALLEWLVAQDCPANSLHVAFGCLMSGNERGYFNVLRHTDLQVSARLLNYAALGGNMRLVQRLLPGCTDLTVPMRMAIYMRHKDIVELFLENDAKLDVVALASVHHEDPAWVHALEERFDLKEIVESSGEPEEKEYVRNEIEEQGDMALLERWSAEGICLAGREQEFDAMVKGNSVLLAEDVIGGHVLTRWTDLAIELGRLDWLEILSRLPQWDWSHVFEDGDVVWKALFRNPVDTSILDWLARRPEFVLKQPSRLAYLVQEGRLDSLRWVMRRSTRIMPSKILLQTLSCPVPDDGRDRDPWIDTMELLRAANVDVRFKLQPASTIQDFTVRQLVKHVSTRRLAWITNNGILGRKCLFQILLRPNAFAFAASKGMEFVSLAQLVAQFEPRCDFHHRMMNAACSAGRVTWAKRLHRAGFGWDIRTAYAAAESGSVELLTWLRAHGCPMPLLDDAHNPCMVPAVRQCIAMWDPDL